MDPVQPTESTPSGRSKGGGGLAELFAGGRWRVLVFCWLGWVFDLYDLVLFAYVKTAVADDLDLELTGGIAWIWGWTFFASGMAGFLFGRIADRHGRRQALVASIVLFSSGALLTAFADGFWSLLIARIVTGLGVGGEWGVGHAAVAEAYPERLRGRAAGVLQAASPVAVALAAVVGCFVVPWFDTWTIDAGSMFAGWHGWQIAYLVSAAPAVLVVFARAAIPDAQDRIGLVGAVEGTAVEGETGDAGSVGELERSGGTRPIGALESVRALFAPGRARASVVLLSLLSLHMVGFWSVYAWLPAALQKDAGATLATVGFFQLGISAVHLFADVVFGFLADRFGRRRMFVAFCLLFAAGLATVALAYESLTHDLGTFAFAMAAVGLGAGTWSLFGVLFAEQYPRGLRATAASTFYNLSRTAQLPMQPFLGWLFATFGTFAPALWIGCGAAVLSAVGIGWLPGQRASERA